MDKYTYLLMQTPFFPQFRARFAAARRRLQQVRPTRLFQLKHLFGQYIPLGLLAPTDEGPGSRERVFSCRRTFWSFLYQVLHPGCPCRKVVRHVRAFFKHNGLGCVDPGTSAYRQARLRLPLDQRRDADLRRGQRMGKHDRLMTWRKPVRKPRYLPNTLWKRVPEQLAVRVLRFQLAVPGFRPESITLMTTLTDARAYPAHELARLYARRWRIELWFRNLKTTLGMETLHCLTPRMLHKEFRARRDGGRPACCARSLFSSQQKGVMVFWPGQSEHTRPQRARCTGPAPGSSGDTGVTAAEPEDAAVLTPSRQ